MESIRSGVGRELVWQQSRASKQEHELTAGDELVAALRLPSAWGSLAEVETAEARWTFKRSGFWRTKSTVRSSGSDEDLATFDPRWTGGGELVMADGTRYLWEGANFWATKFAWKDSLGQELVRFGSKSGLLKMSAVVEVLPAGAESRDLPLLVTYGYYLLIMTHRDSGSTAGAVAATTAATSGD